jgi:hypothetical protein
VNIIVSGSTLNNSTIEIKDSAQYYKQNSNHIPGRINHKFADPDNKNENN